MSHTPGPWIWGNNFCGLYGAGPDNEVLAYYHYEGMHLSSGTASEANARLIAAAPDLLESLQNAVSMNLHARVSEPWLKKAHEAIAKATGESA